MKLPKSLEIKCEEATAYYEDTVNAHEGQSFEAGYAAGVTDAAQLSQQLVEALENAMNDFQRLRLYAEAEDCRKALAEYKKAMGIE